MKIKSSFCYFSTYRQLLTLFAMKFFCPVFTHFFGIHSAALSWFRSYLSEKKQLVMIQDNRSSTAQLDFGTPHVIFILHIALLSLTTEKQHMKYMKTTPNFVSHFHQKMMIVWFSSFKNVLQTLTTMLENKLMLNYILKNKIE